MTSRVLRLYTGSEYTDFAYPQYTANVFLGYRYVLEAGLTTPTARDPVHNLWHAELSWHTEIRHSDGEWRHGKSYYRCIGLRSDFDLGRSHLWYDGSHCACALGWLYIAWGAGGCELAHDGGHEDTWLTRLLGRLGLIKADV